VGITNSNCARQAVGVTPAADGKLVSAESRRCLRLLRMGCIPWGLPRPYAQRQAAAAAGPVPPGRGLAGRAWPAGRPAGRFFNRSEHTVAPRWPQCAPGGEGGRRGRASVREGGRWVRRAARGGCRHARLPPRRCCGALRLCDQVLCPCACSSAAPVHWHVLTYCSALNFLFFNRGFPRPVRRRRRRCRRALARGGGSA